MKSSITGKERAERVIYSLPLIADVADPVMALVLGGLVVLGGIGVAEAHSIFPGDKEAPTHALQSVGSLVVVLLAYFTANTLAFTRSHHRAELIARALDQLGSHEEAVRVGAVCLLHGMSLDVPNCLAEIHTVEAQREAIRCSLEELHRSRDLRPETKALIEAALHDLEATPSERGVMRRPWNK
jgi:hypothetical protein